MIRQWGTAIVLAGATTAAGCSGTVTPGPGGGTPSTASPSAPPACVASQLQATAVAESGPGGGYEVVELTNGSTSPCDLQGYLGLSIPASGSQLRALDIVRSPAAGDKGFGTAGSASRPAPVTLAPGAPSDAWVALQVGNWCGASLASSAVKIELAGAQAVAIAVRGSWLVGGCTDSRGSIVVREGPVQEPVSHG